MKRLDPRVARTRVLKSFAQNSRYLCEPLEQRVLLDGDPVIVLTEPVSLTVWNEVTSGTMPGYLWTNPLEKAWNLEEGQWDWNTDDRDGNGYPDDAYGWNFFANNGAGSPNFIDNAHGNHGASIM